MQRWLGLVLIVLIVLILSFPGPATWAGESAEERLREAAAAAEVLAAFEAKDMARLAALAARTQPDPWLVADALLGRGEHAAAEAFAKAAQGKDVERLAAYVASREDKADDGASRKAFAAWQTAFDAKDEAAYRAALKDVEPDLSTVIGIYVASLQVLDMRGRVTPQALSDAASNAADAALRLGWLYQAARVLHANGYVAYRNGHYGLALGQYEKALAIQERRGDQEAVALVLHNLGNAENGLGHLRKAESYYRRALALREQQADAAGIAGSLIDLAALQRSLGDLRYARLLYRRGIAQAEKAEQQAWLANALEGQAHVLSEEGADGLARQHHERALRLRQKLGDRLAIASSLHNLGILESELGHADEALDLFRRALELRVALKHAPHVLQTVRAAAQAHRRAGQWQRALEAYEQARRIHENMGDASGALHARAMMGAILAEQGAHDDAKRTLEAVARTAHDRREPFVATLAATELAALHLAADRPAEALAAAFPAVAAARAVGRDVAARLFAVGAAAAVRSEMTEAALTFLDAGRAGALVRHVASRDALLAAEIPDTLVSEEAAARERLASATRALSKTTRGGTLRERRSRHEALRAAETELRAALARTSEYAREQVEPVQPDLLRLEGLQGRLHPQEALVLYGTYDDEVHAVLVTARSAKTHRLGSREALGRAAALLADADDEAQVRTAAEALRAQLVKPLELPSDLDTAARHVLVAPCEELWAVPPALLFDRPVAVLPSATTFTMLRDDARKPGRGVLAVGDPSAAAGLRPLPPLPGAREEAMAVGDALLLGKQATREALLVAFGKRVRWRGLHVAGHAHIDADYPDDSHLVLASTKSDAGRLGAPDLQRLEVPADLVVLSVDRGARGAFQAGEGLLGLPQAFLMAGAQAVLASLWHVDDEATRALMVKFHELWNPPLGAGRGAAAALRAAQDHVRAQKRWKHPRYWAGWALYGLPE